MNPIISQFHSLSTLLTVKQAPEYMVAFSDEDDKYWSQFCSDVSCLSDYLSDSSELRWALGANNSYLFAVAFMALCHSHKEIVLPGNLQPSALAELSSNFEAILIDSDIQPPASVKIVNLETIPEPKTELLQTFHPLELDEISITLFTSGSSGKPKAIQKTLRHFEEELLQHQTIWGDVIKGTKVYSTVSHQHIYGLLFRILFPLATKRSFDSNNFDYPEQVLRAASEDSVLISSPALLKRLTGNVSSSNHSYRAVFSSGGPLSLEAARNCKELLDTLPFEVFGSTETGGIGYRQQSSDSSPWTLFPKVKACLSEDGCIAVLSPHIDKKHWYQMSDRCCLIDDEHFLLLGRTDKIVKIEEKRVSLTEVEQRLGSLDDINEAAVILRDNNDRSILAAVLVLSPSGKSKVRESGKGAFWISLRKQLREWLEPVAIPRQLRFVDEIPLNSQGKRQVSELNALFELDD